MEIFHSSVQHLIVLFCESCPFFPGNVLFNAWLQYEHVHCVQAINVVLFQCSRVVACRAKQGQPPPLWPPCEISWQPRPARVQTVILSTPVPLTVKVWFLVKVILKLVTSLLNTQWTRQLMLLQAHHRLTKPCSLWFLQCLRTRIVHACGT